MPRKLHRPHLAVALMLCHSENYCQLNTIQDSLSSFHFQLSWCISIMSSLSFLLLNDLLHTHTQTHTLQSRCVVCTWLVQLELLLSCNLQECRGFSFGFSYSLQWSCSHPNIGMGLGARFFGFSTSEGRWRVPFPTVWMDWRGVKVSTETQSFVVL